MSILPNRFYELEDVETGQAIFRLWAGPAFLFTVLLIRYFAPSPGVERALTCAALYSLLGVCWLYFIAWSRVSAHARRLLIIFLDLIIWSFGLCLAGEIYALTLWVPLTVSMGNGLRYSPKYGFISAAVSGVCVAFALLLSPYWRGLPFVAIGIFLIVTLVPFYAFLLSKRIVISKQLMEQRAAALEMAIKYDALTGALNRTGFAREFDTACAHAQQSGRVAALLVIDLDGFKNVNDCAGHGAGDAMLRQVTTAVRGCLRIADTLARLGGDEFAVVLHSLQAPDDARWIADKIIQTVSTLEVPGFPALRVGASIGLCLLPSSGSPTMDEALAAADGLMYASKKAGKGRVTVAS
jgi:diguanylate cyclase (GGDEF)-like protein